MPIVDLLATSSIDRDTEITFIRDERDWLERANEQGRFLDSGRMLPVLPANVAGNGNGHAGEWHALALRRQRPARTLMSPGAVFADLALPPNIPFLNWPWDDLLFLILAGVMLGAALFVVLGRNIVRSGLAMMLCFAALAGIYALAGAVLVAATQVLVYIGAISILILFAIMLTQSKSRTRQT